MMVKILRSEAGKDEIPHYEEFNVPADSAEEITVMDVLDYISVHCDPALGYYKHSACNHGICGRCLLRVNGKPALACITKVDLSEDLLLEPAGGRKVMRDLVTEP